MPDSAPSEKPTVRADDVCPCRSAQDARPFAECCGPLVQDGEPAATPEALMRSRYTAFATKNAEHLWRTWHPATRPHEVGDVGEARWTGLTVTAHAENSDGTGTVDFEARFVTETGERGVVREHSRFARRAGRWFYVDGDEVSTSG